jgi:phage recombination protein Bet
MTDLITTNEQGVTLFTQQAATLVRKMLCPTASDAELAFFASYCKRLSLDPLAGHVHLVPRRQKVNGEWVDVAKPEISVAGLLVLAERSQKYRGRTKYEWCDSDGNWVDVWLDTDTPPSAARVGVYRDGAPEPIVGVATWDSYAAKTRNGSLTHMWAQHGPRMLGKCALSLALREALPAQFAGVYTDVEMDQVPIPESASDASDVEGDAEPVEAIEDAEIVTDTPQTEDPRITTLRERSQALPEDQQEALKQQLRRSRIDMSNATEEDIAKLTMWIDAAADEAGVPA